MRIKNRKLRKLLWEIRRNAIVLAYYVIMLIPVILAILFFVSIPEIIGWLIWG